MSDQRPTRARVYADKVPGTGVTSRTNDGGAGSAPAASGGRGAPFNRRRTDRKDIVPGTNAGTSANAGVDAGADGAVSIGWVSVMILFVLGSALGGAASMGLGLVGMTGQ